uniref:Plasmid replication protein origin binding domain-containing protein n=1 Tax=uncultured prokaryote TaxID=198431 RepID=A0A0H5Q0C9_9ZZZZ|nr:hypothetical protein [uncultured prokaryote]
MANSSIISCISGAVNDETQMENIISVIEDFPVYFYILHDKDKDASGNYIKPHLHFVIKGRHNLKVWADILQIPEHMIEITRSVSGSVRYLIHKDNPEKYQYSADDVFTNNSSVLHKFLADQNSYSFKEFSIDIRRLKYGRMSRVEFEEKYNNDLSRMGKYSQWRIINDLDRIEEFRKNGKSNY